ncbi:bifunctional glycosyltransferase family 2/GtrA family protein [Paenibacillus sp. HB172176]|uniref:bifunctional glycosyltransferase family 2/GtrA family protein n=1 Tax=Paenibacillus sp. HB172176 TaxID=2493690 RepID=UPI00143B23BD|nr:bifunctional glycosyltransferase family 2/GtrA family protein [Paenibacillus sp. HB172176]
MMILIPAYEPDERLIALIHDLKKSGNSSILVVDDGSSEAYRAIFHSAEEAGCTVIAHSKNMGKGRALKTGFMHAKLLGNTGGVVCADSDGQHLPKDIMRIVNAIEGHPDTIVLGSRRFTGKVPMRSRFGNTATRLVYSYATGQTVGDTQTGLRGYSADMLNWLCDIPGERFEYEMNMLLEAKSAGYPILEIEIDTVYLEDNKSSHFRPLADSALIYLPFLKFMTSSGFSAVIDFVLVLLLQWLCGNLLVSVLGARITSSIFNYTMNRTFVFNSKKSSGNRNSLLRYFTLVAIIMMLNYGLMYALHERLWIPLAATKLATEAVLFLFSYWMQRRFVY